MARTTDNTEPLNFLISAKLKDQIVEYARTENLTLAAACRVLLRDALSRNASQSKASG
jgi:hypothetical protein